MSSVLPARPLYYWLPHLHVSPPACPLPTEVALHLHHKTATTPHYTASSHYWLSISLALNITGSPHLWLSTLYLLQTPLALNTTGSPHFWLQTNWHFTSLPPRTTGSLPYTGSSHYFFSLHKPPVSQFIFALATVLFRYHYFQLSNYSSLSIQLRNTL